jgi:hypothetical protein
MICTVFGCWRARPGNEERNYSALFEARKRAAAGDSLTPVTDTAFLIMLTRTRSEGAGRRRKTHLSGHHAPAQSRRPVRSALEAPAIQVAAEVH